MLSSQADVVRYARAAGVGPRARRRRKLALAVFGAALLAAVACKDEDPVASIALSAPDTGATMWFREPIVVKATPLTSLGFPVPPPVIVVWTSKTPAVLSVVSLGASGDSARISATGIGTGEIRVTAGSQSKSLRVTVQDTVYAVSVTPAATNLVVGDTISFAASVSGPAGASSAVRWDVSSATVLRMVGTPDSTTVRVQAVAAGSATVRAISIADASKWSLATVTGQMGSLAFLSQPTTVQRDVSFTQPVAVIVRDGSGVVSARAAGQILLGLAQNGCGAELAGSVIATVSNGIAAFPRVFVTRRCMGLTIVASANPIATAATSQAFDVTARGCGDVPLTMGATVAALLESVDCAESRADGTHYVHTYSFTTPLASPPLRWNLTAAATGMGARIESCVWIEAPAACWVAEKAAAGSVSMAYALALGDHRFVVTSSAPGGTGAYTLRPSEAPFGLSAVNPPECLWLVTRAASVRANLSSACAFNFASMAFWSPAGRRFVLYLPAGQGVTVTMREVAGTGDPYLEVFDVTNAGLPRLIAHDDDSGGGPGGRDARAMVDSAPTARFIEIRAGQYRSAVGAFDLVFSS